MTDDAALAHSIPAAARRLGIPTKLLCEFISRGEVPVVELGDRVVVADSDQRALLDRHRRVASPEAR